MTELAAFVGTEPVTRQEVDHRTSMVRASAGQDLFPADDSPDGRQIRRWVTQLVVTERLLAQETLARQLQPTSATTGPDSARLRSQLGTVVTAALGRAGVRHPLFVDVAKDVAVTGADISAYDLSDPAAESVAPRAFVRHWARGRAVNDGRPHWVRVGDLGAGVAQAVLAADAGTTVTAEGHTLEVLQVLTPVGAAPRTGTEQDHAVHLYRQCRVFSQWMAAAVAQRVQLMPGYEHPGDPRQADSSHRH